MAPTRLIIKRSSRAFNNSFATSFWSVTSEWDLQGMGIQLASFVCLFVCVMPRFPNLHTWNLPWLFWGRNVWNYSWGRRWRPEGALCKSTSRDVLSYRSWNRFEQVFTINDAASPPCLGSFNKLKTRLSTCSVNNYKTINNQSTFISTRLHRVFREKIE